MRVLLPYGLDSVEISVPDEKLIGSFSPKAKSPLSDPVAALSEALKNPLAAEPISRLARGRERVVIVVDDTTRAVPTPLLLDALLPELHGAGVEDSKVTVLVATGLHRSVREEEIVGFLGRWAGQVKFECHDARDSSRLASLGKTSLGTSISVNRTFLEADCKILTGDVEFHQFCGFGGGAKSIYPGLADAEAIRASHSKLDWEGTGPGRRRGNPIREEIEEVGAMAGVDFMLCTVLDSNHEIVSIHAGELNAAFEEACRVVDQIYRVKVRRAADLVIASAGGHPRDASIYQAQKAISSAARIVEPGGDIILVAACGEGSGSRLFEEWMAGAYRPEDITAMLREKFVMGGHKAYQIVRDLAKARVHLLSTVAPGKVRGWFLEPLRNAGSIEEMVARSRVVSVLPQATVTLAEL